MLTITQCAGVQAEVREETKCVQDLPVFYKGKEMFIDSGSSILKEKSPAVSCQQPAVFRIGTHYYSQVFIGSKSNNQSCLFSPDPHPPPPVSRCQKIHAPCTSAKNWKWGAVSQWARRDQHHYRCWVLVWSQRRWGHSLHVDSSLPTLWPKNNR